MRTRARGLSDSLQEQGFDALAGVHPPDPRAGADAADADHFVGDLDERGLLEHMPLTGVQRPRVSVQYRTGSWCG
jgi:hypothetical protein